jgi:hypothetical protein
LWPVPNIVSSKSRTVQFSTDLSRYREMSRDSLKSPEKTSLSIMPFLSLLWWIIICLNY